MAQVLVNGEPFNATGTVKDGLVVLLEQAKAEPAPPPGPFDAFTETVRTSLETAGIKTAEDLKGKTKEGLVALEGIGDATAEKLLALAPAE